MTADRLLALYGQVAEAPDAMTCQGKIEYSIHELRARRANADLIGIF